MGRSATLCNKLNGGMEPLDWETISGERQHVNENLKLYLNGDSCIRESLKDTAINWAYIQELSNAFVSILIEELVNLDDKNCFESSLCFAIIYAELWRQATLLEPFETDKQASKITWIPEHNHGFSELIDINELKALNAKWCNWECNALESEYFLDFSKNLASGYLKALEESRSAWSAKNIESIKHHMAILGDIYQEMLQLHATLMPHKQSRFFIQSNKVGNG